MGELDSALCIQLLAMEKKAITGEYMFQLGLFQAARDMNAEAHQSFEKSMEILQALVKQIKKIQIENEYNIDFDLDSLVYEMEKQQKI